MDDHGDSPQLPDAENNAYLNCSANCISAVRECGWEEFLNRYENDEVYAIEILRVRDSADKEHTQLREERMQKTEAGIRPSFLAYGSLESVPKGPFTSPCQRDPMVATQIHCIRINSRHLLRILSAFIPDSEVWNGRTVSFELPFAGLVHFHESVREELTKLEKEVKQTSISALRNGSATDNDQWTKSKESHPISDNEINSGSSIQNALKDLRCYVDFMETNLISKIQWLIAPVPTRPHTIRFTDLWYLFKPGDLIYIPDLRSCLSAEWLEKRQFEDPEYLHVRRSAAEKRVFRVYANDWTTSHYSIYCYHLDFNGHQYEAVRTSVCCHYFEGEKFVSELPFFPLRFSRNWKFLEDVRDDGERFVRYIDERYAFYTGWTLMKGSRGEVLVDVTGEKIKSPEYIESTVLVDFVEALQHCPQWRLDSLPESIPEEGPQLLRQRINELPILVWRDQAGRRISGKRYEMVLDSMSIFHRQKIDFLHTKPYGLVEGSRVPPAGEDLALLTRRMFAYAVRDRKFVQIDCRYLCELNDDKQYEPFEQLQILEENKRLISSLVQGHFKRKLMEEKGKIVGTQDLIKGKGRGVVILLHGAPGVGKTATAEAVAQKWRKPLFSITCGDIGCTPEKVESSLKEIFRLAHLWDCVLLFDEADVFIAHREKSGSDIQRNALVSVFLRMLEYYNGVLFLTTNRVGVLDEAVKSRVHLHLKYSPLTQSQTKEIFRHNIQRLKDMENLKEDKEDQLVIVETEILKFADEHFERHSNSGSGLWNGRQIRNAFLIAASLAHYDGDEERKQNPAMQKQLRSQHFEIVHRATESYEAERSLIHNMNDDELAYDRVERLKDSVSPKSPGKKVEDTSLGMGLSRQSTTLMGFTRPGPVPGSNQSTYNPGIEMQMEAQRQMGGHLPTAVPPRVGGHLPMGASMGMGVQQQMDGRPRMVDTYSGLQDHEEYGIPSGEHSRYVSSEHPMPGASPGSLGGHSGRGRGY